MVIYRMQETRPGKHTLTKGMGRGQMKHITRRLRDSMRVKINEEMKELEEESEENSVKAQK